METKRATLSLIEKDPNIISTSTIRNHNNPTRKKVAILAIATLFI
jgi:hypothetical protein